MRPAGEINQALVAAATTLAADFPPGRGPTLLEIAHKACVSYDAARAHVPKLVNRSKQLCKVNERVVDYRNRPVAEYAPVVSDVLQGEGWVDLGHCLSSWAR